MDLPICRESECTAPVRYSGLGVCNSHYAKHYRKTRKPSHKPWQGYRIVKAHGHPLAGKDGRVYEHRLVLWEKVGESDQQCAHCASSVSWFAKEHKRKLVVDHLDGNVSNNDPANLAPSCHGCNSHR